MGDVQFADLFKILLSVSAQRYDTMPFRRQRRSRARGEASRSAGITRFIIVISHCFRLRVLDRVDSRRLACSFGVGEVDQAV